MVKLIQKSSAFILALTLFVSVTGCGGNGGSSSSSVGGSVSGLNTPASVSVVNAN
jgi:hypothetical protein